MLTAQEAAVWGQGHVSPFTAAERSYAGDTASPTRLAHTITTFCISAKTDRFWSFQGSSQGHRLKGAAALTKALEQTLTCLGLEALTASPSGSPLLPSRWNAPPAATVSPARPEAVPRHRRAERTPLRQE